MLRTDFLYPQSFNKINFRSDEDLTHLTDFVFLGNELTQTIEKEKEEIRNNPLWLWANKNFYNEDEMPWQMPPAEFTIFEIIALRLYPRVEIISSTQYGKTITISRGILARIVNYSEEFLVVVPDLKRGKILIDYIIKDCARNPFFKKKLVGIKLEERDALNRLLEEKSKAKLTFQVVGDDNTPRYGSVEILTCEAKRRFDVINTIMGFGGRNIIIDESALTDDEIDAGIFRMLAGKGADTFLVKVGNPFYRNHFLKDWKNKNYKKVYIDYKIGISDGRYVMSFIEEAKDKLKFDVLYECRFPQEGAQDLRGWTPLFTETELAGSFVDNYRPFGVPNMGVDVAEGKGQNESIIVVRNENVAKIDFASNELDLMDFCAEIDNSIDINEVDVRNGAVDCVGPGAMIPAKLKQSGKPIQGVNVGEACENEQDKARYADKNAYLSWKAYQWVKSGGKLLRNNRWYQFLNVKYKTDERGRMRMMPKDEMRRQGIDSPDAWDAFKLSFSIPQVYYEKSLGDERFTRKMRAKKKHSKFFKMTGY